MNQPFDIFVFLKDIFLLLIAWFGISASFFSWGNLISKILSIKINGTKGIIAKIWLGFVFCILFFSIYHIFFPINAFASIIFYIPGIIYFFIKYSKNLYAFAKSIGSFKVSIILLTLLAASAIAIQPPMNLDTWLYHLHSIKWVNEYPIIKGLGNLHGRLGFNQLFFLYSASLNFHPYFNDYAFHISNSFLYALFFVGMFLNGTLLDLILLCLFFFIPMPYHWINSPTPDIASSLLQIVIFRYFIETFYRETDNKNKIGLISLTMILSALLISLKLSNFIFASGIVIISINYVRKNMREDFRIITKSFVLICLLFFVWIIRGYIQTGYPLFPSSIGGINFEWTVPKRIANLEENYIYVFARSSENKTYYNSTIPDNYSWIKPWIKKNFIDLDIFNGSLSENTFTAIFLVFFPFTLSYWGFGSVTLTAISIVFVIITTLAALTHNISFQKVSKLYTLLLIDVVSIAFWFFTAPLPRFANGIFIILFCTSLLLLMLVHPLGDNIKKVIKNILMFYSLIMFIWLFSSSYSLNEFAINGMFVLKKPPLNKNYTYSGLQIYSPIDNACMIGDSELLATPNFNPYLSLIKDSINEGFCIKKQ